MLVMGLLQTAAAYTRRQAAFEEMAVPKATVTKKGLIQLTAHSGSTAEAPPRAPWDVVDRLNEGIYHHIPCFNPDIFLYTQKCNNKM